MAKVYNVVNVEKDRNIITITIEDNRTVVIDCSAHTITSVTNRKVKNVPNLNFSSKLSKYEIITQLNDLENSQSSQLKCKLIETLWENLGMIEQLYGIPEIPKGYVNYCKEHNLLINKTTYKHFSAIQKFKNCSPKEKDFYVYIYKHFCHEDNDIPELYKIIYQIYNSTVKSKSYDEIFKISYAIQDFLNAFTRGYTNTNDKHDFLSIIDTNKTFGKNVEIIKNYMNEKRKEKILKNENLIRSLENLEFDKYIIKVPLTIEDFTNEGKQQNNCVGYYYHDSIANMENLIYFIRKKENPEHSFVTCRFNIKEKETIEHRIVNNQWYSDDEKIIKMCDEFINSIL